MARSGAAGAGVPSAAFAAPVPKVYLVWTLGLEAKHAPMLTIGAIGDVEEIENVWIPMSDGCRIAARIWLPRGAHADPVPAILECIPYRKSDFTRGRDEPIH